MRSLLLMFLLLLSVFIHDAQGRRLSLEGSVLAEDGKHALTKEELPDVKNTAHDERENKKWSSGSIRKLVMIHISSTTIIALGNWHIKGLKEGERGGPLSAEPELKLTTLTKEDEFLIIGSDGIWDVFRSQNAVDFARRRLQEHNNVKMCCKDIVNEAKKRGATDNLTVVMVCFHSEPPPPVLVQRGRVRRCISAEGLQSLKFLLQG